MIPTGNVTFLFTDIEGSTMLSQEFPESLPLSLERHNKILRNAFESYKGFIFKIIGDAYCCAFERAEDAVKAAVEAQINLTNEKWDEAVIKVRMGIHSGKAEWSGNDYSCYITLARAARVMSAAYGEQVLISNDVYLLCLESAAGGFKAKEISFRDLGERRLKDVIQPIRLYQIVAPGLREDFPPLKTLDARPNNLPIQLTNFIGREDDMKLTKKLLKESRLLTITGTGGAGKTRLSLQTGADMIDDFANGVWFLELAAISDPDSIRVAFINILGLKEESKKTPEETLTGYLKNKEILIILDNCEHLIDACAELAEKLLSSCPDLKIIATSREALNIPGEQIYKIPPLTLPDPNNNDTPEQLSQYESVRLFIERALAVNPNFRVNNKNAPAIAAICSHLDGIPLAIELAAARIKVLSPEKIYERLDDSFNLLTGGNRTALPRQQTLRALIDWSYDLLTETEKILWSRLSVFSCGWTLKEAEEICSDEVIEKKDILDLLTGLAEKSIIIYDESKERYKLLDTIKQYGMEKLKNKNEIFSKFLDYFLELSQTAKPGLKGSNVKIWLDMLDDDHNNFITAVEWGAKNEDPEKGAIVADALGRFWEIRGKYSTGIRILEIILKRQADLSKNTKAKVLNWAGVLNRYQGNFERARKFFEESLYIFREIGSKKGIATSLNSLGTLAFTQGDFDTAKIFNEESRDIQKEIGDKQGLSSSLNNLGTLAFSQGDYEQARKFFEESMAIKRETGDKKGIAGSLNNLGGFAFSQGEYEQAEKYYEESLAIRKEIGDKQGIAVTLNNLGGLELYQGDYKKAKNFFEESLAIRKDIGDKKGIAALLGNVGSVANAQGDYEKTKKIYEESLSIFREIGDKKGIADFLNNLGSLVSSQREFEQAKKYFEESLSIFREIGDKQGNAGSLNNLGTLAFTKGDYEQAKKFFEESLVIQNEIGDKHGIASSLNGLGSLAFTKGDYEKAKKFFEESLNIQNEIGDKHGIATSLNNLGNASNSVGNYFRAVMLLSASEKLMNEINGELDKVALKIKDETIKELRNQLSDIEFNKYWEEGKRMTMEEVCQLIVNS